MRHSWALRPSPRVTLYVSVLDSSGLLVIVLEMYHHAVVTRRVINAGSGSPLISARENGE
jgi:hypothetical protein